MNFLTEHGISSYEELEERAAATTAKNDTLVISIIIGLSMMLPSDP